MPKQIERILLPKRTPRAILLKVIIRKQLNERSVFFSFRFLVTTILGALTMGVVCVFGSQAAQVGLLGTWVSILAGLTLAHIAQVERKSRTYASFLSAAGVPAQLAQHPKLLEYYADISLSMGKLPQQTDPVLSEFIIKKLASIADQTELLAHGEIVFSSTESWRTVYEQILRCKNVNTYRSVSWFKSADYWQDEPGRKSMELNFDLLRKGLSIERIVIVRDKLWPATKTWPEDVPLAWMRTQHEQGMKISLVRESEILGEPDLCCDCGIYGSSAVGIQETDDRCRTLKFTLRFDPHDVLKANDRWNRLLLYSRPFKIAD